MVATAFDDVSRVAVLESSFRARMRVAVNVAPDHLPEHLKVVVRGLSKELDERVFEPMLGTPSPEVQTRSFRAFVDLWQALLSALGPWMQEEPDRPAEVAKIATNAWSDPVVITRLGADACGWFASAQKVRVDLATLALSGQIVQPLRDEDVIARACFMADFSIMFGLFLAHTHRTFPTALPLEVARSAHHNAKRGYVWATTHLVDVDDEVRRLTSEIHDVTAGMIASTQRLTGLARQHRAKLRP